LNELQFGNNFSDPVVLWKYKQPDHQIICLIFYKYTKLAVQTLKVKLKQNKYDEAF